jgi:hypothetical protein
MTDVEREAVSRLVEAGSLRVHVVGWGVVNNPRVVIGDLRIGIQFRMDFDAPAVPQPNHYFDLELRTDSGLLLYKERQPTIFNHQPVQICAGMYLDLAWDIAVRHMDPKIVKALVPGATGFTSRWQDRDTGEMTLTGNTQMSSDAKQRLRVVRALEESSKKDTKDQAKKATKIAADRELVAKALVKLK